MNVQVDDFEAALEDYIRSIKTYRKAPRARNNRMLPLLFSPQISQDLVNRFDEEIQRVKEPLVEEVRNILNTMPDMEAYNSDPSSYYNTINRNRFAKLGFRTYEVVYKRTRTWDWQAITAGILVPESLDMSKEVGVHVKWHGGALGSSSWDFEPWFGGYLLRHAAANNAIIVAPNYRLLPEATGRDILRDVRHFWSWFHGRAPPGVPSGSFGAVVKRFLPGLNVNPERLIISGDSAGAFLAVYSWLRCKTSAVRALYLAYPMLGYYNWPITQQEFIYRGCPTTKSWTRTAVDAIDAKIGSLERRNLTPTTVKRTPPDGCAVNFKLGFTGRWKEIFQRERKDGRTVVQDIPGMVFQMLQNGCSPRSLPKIFVHHGHDDPQCPISKTKDFLETLRRTWYSHCSEIVSFTEMKSLEGKGEVGHGYDHDLDEEKEPWLREILDGISAAWDPET